MTDIWTPDLSTPLLTFDAVTEVCNLLVQNPTRTMKRTVSDLEDDHRYVYKYVERIGKLVEDVTGAKGLAKSVLIGAAVSSFAYKEAGFYPIIDSDVMIRSADYISQTPPPEVFDTATMADPELCDLLKSIAPTMDMVSEEGGTVHSLRIGAGCTRIFFGHGLAS